MESRWHCSSKQQQLTWPPAESSPIMGCFWLELHPLVCGLCGRPPSGRPADRLCFPPLPSQVRSRPTTSSARAAGDLAAAWRWPGAAPSPSATPRARVERGAAACVLERARWRARWRLEAAKDASRGRARCARARPGWTHQDGGRRVECECMRVSCARSCVCRVYSTVCGPRGREHSVDVPRRP